jgi:VWFA-related protein
MRLFASLSSLLFVLVVLSAAGQTDNADDVPYRIEFNPREHVTLQDRDDKGNRGKYITVKFTLTYEGQRALKGDSANYKMVIEEDGKPVHEEDVPVPEPTDELSVVLALDTSGSMKESKRMDQARLAAETFLKKLPERADCGLILFDHEIRPPILPPVLDREPLFKLVQTVQPRGGTAYLDAAAKGIDILKDFPRDKALVIITDGIDLNSKAPMPEVIEQAKKKKVRIYTIGIGEPGKMEQVTSVLVLDRSGSMKPPANSGDTTPKILAMHRAASRFVDIMPPTGKTTLLPFSTGVDTPGPFSNNKFALKSVIQKLSPHGETALFDAVYAGLATLEAENSPGKRVVVAMTDGVDNSSRRRVEEVIERAKEAKIPLYLLGFGRPGELDATTMQMMATQTGGQYYHAGNEKDLLEIFENLSIKIHDDGIDEVTLGKLADSTGGSYFHARKVTELKFILEQVTQSIQKKPYAITFASLRQVADGTQRNIALKLVRSGQVVTEQTGRVQTHGVVIAEMNHMVYLAFLGGLGFLLVLPSLVRR